ncbi:MAG: WbuC family cupin fold metalloprotein [Bacteroidales bacterium]|nr:WbuC family cupin fold metalloprotein [Bacteroidales bacterium]
MVITQQVLDELVAKAKEDPRLRMNLDLRNSSGDQSQRMLNAVEPGTVLPIHRHLNSSVTIVCIRGHFEELIYDDNGALMHSIDMKPGENVINLPIGTWHSIKSLESGTVLLEVQDGPYHPLEEDEIMVK